MARFAFVGNIFSLRAISYLLNENSNIAHQFFQKMQISVVNIRIAFVVSHAIQREWPERLALRDIFLQNVWNIEHKETKLTCVQFYFE